MCVCACMRACVCGLLDWCNNIHSVASARISFEYLEMCCDIYPGHPFLWGGSTLCLLVPLYSDQVDCVQVSIERCHTCVAEGELFYYTDYY